MNESKTPLRIRAFVWVTVAVFLAAVALVAAAMTWNVRKVALDDYAAQATRFVAGAEAALNRSLLSIDVLLASMDEVLGLSGATIAWIDPQNILKVGPESAGSTPGPVCYGRGGTRATITDAFVACGLVGHSELGYDAVSVDAQASRDAVAVLADGLGRKLEDTAQGIIDNGGLEYFYESDFPANPPYSLFVEAFRRIGAESVASCIEDTSRMFPFPQPHLHESRRQQWLDAVKNDETHEFVRLSRRACGDESVFRKLAEYVERHRSAYGAV